MAVRSYVPESARGPLGFASLGVSVVSLVLGYIFILLGVTLVYDLNGLGDAITNTEAYTVIAVGAVLLAVTYLGWKGFIEFSY